MLEIFHYLVRGKCSLWTLNHLLFSGQICLKEGVRSGNFCLGLPRGPEEKFNIFMTHQKNLNLKMVLSLRRAGKCSTTVDIVKSKSRLKDKRKLVTKKNTVKLAGTTEFL